MASLDDVIARMRMSNTDVPEAILREVAPYKVRATDDGGWVFRFDPLHQTTSPSRFDAEGFEAYIARITCPVLHVWGRAPEGFELYAKRADLFANARRVVFEDAGHMIHWTRPDPLCAALLSFFDDVERAGHGDARGEGLSWRGSVHERLRVRNDPAGYPSPKISRHARIRMDEYTNESIP